MVGSRWGWIAVALLTTGTTACDTLPPPDDDDDEDRLIGDVFDHEAGEDADVDGRTRCWTAVEEDGRLLLLMADLDMGGWAEKGLWGGDVERPLRLTSMARIGDTLVMPTLDGRSLLELDTASSTLRIHVTDEPIEAVTADAGELLALCAEGLCGYDTVDDLLAGTPTAIYPGHFAGSRVGVRGDELFTLGHAGTAVLVHDLATGDLLREIQLEGDTTHVFGFSAAGDHLHVLRAWHTDDPRVHRHDPDTGARLATVTLPESVHGDYPTGLWCE